MTTCKCSIHWRWYPLSVKKVFTIYQPISTLKSGSQKKIIENIFASLNDDTEYLPEFCQKKNNFKSITTSLKAIHLPEIYNPAIFEKLKKRFIYTEFLLFSLELQYVRNCLKQRNRIHIYHYTPNVKDKINCNLPFLLTDEQITAFSDIVNDLLSPFTMQRLLQGDVGSGKTVIAFLSMSLATENGYQGAFLAPTEYWFPNTSIKPANFFWTKLLLC